MREGEASERGVESDDGRRSLSEQTTQRGRCEPEEHREGDPTNRGRRGTPGTNPVGVQPRNNTGKDEPYKPREREITR